LHISFRIKMGQSFFHFHISSPICFFPFCKEKKRISTARIAVNGSHFLCICSQIRPSPNKSHPFLEFTRPFLKERKGQSLLMDTKNRERREHEGKRTKGCEKGAAGSAAGGSYGPSMVRWPRQRPSTSFLLAALQTHNGRGICAFIIPFNVIFF
jgi:hypothetical protein